jgi:hypothetical protein
MAGANHDTQRNLLATAYANAQAQEEIFTGMNSAAVIAFPRPQQPAHDALEAAFSARPALRSVDTDPDEPPLRPPWRGPRANTGVVDRPDRRGNDLVVPRLEPGGPR